MIKCAQPSVTFIESSGVRLQASIEGQHPAGYTETQLYLLLTAEWDFILGLFFIELHITTSYHIHLPALNVFSFYSSTASSVFCLLAYLCFGFNNRY